jgi:hypothetical protein
MANPDPNPDPDDAKDPTVLKIMVLECEYLSERGWKPRKLRGKGTWLDPQTGHIYSHSAAVREQMRRQPKPWQQILVDTDGCLEVLPNETPLVDVL